MFVLLVFIFISFLFCYCICWFRKKHSRRIVAGTKRHPFRPYPSLHIFLIINRCPTVSAMPCFCVVFIYCWEYCSHLASARYLALGKQLIVFIVMDDWLRTKLNNSDGSYDVSLYIFVFSFSELLFSLYSKTYHNIR